MRLRNNDHGVTAVEYALFIGLVGLAILFGVTALTTALQTVAVAVVSDPVIVGGTVVEAATVEDDEEAATPGSPCASHQVWHHPNGPCTPLLAPSETSGEMSKDDDESFEVLADYTYAKAPYTAAMSITGCADNWTGPEGTCSVDGDEIEYVAPNKSGTVTVTYTLTVSYPYNGQIYSGVLPGQIFTIAVGNN